jgi:hypothetical protein
VSATAPPSEPRLAPTGAPPSAGEVCPLCGAELAPTQEWCLNCGAAARTRLAAAPNWKAPIALVAAVAVLALGAIAAALVKLAGDSGPAPPPLTRTVTGPAAAAPSAAAPPATTAATTTNPAAPTTSAPAPTTSGGAAGTTPGAATAAPRAGAGASTGAQPSTRGSHTTTAPHVHIEIPGVTEPGAPPQSTK